MRIFTRSGAYRFAEFRVAGTDYLGTVDRQVAREAAHSFSSMLRPFPTSRALWPTPPRRSIPVALLIFMLSLPAIIYLARSISKPLARLSEEAELIRSFQLDDPIKMHSRVHEVNTLIRSMSGMKGTIREVSKFVPKALVRDILESESQVAVGGETRRVSILFTDVKDFTPIAEGMSPDGLMANMSEYFEELASLIIESEWNGRQIHRRCDLRLLERAAWRSRGTNMRPA